MIVASKGGADHHPAWYLNVPPYKNYQASTTREIPLVMLAAIEPTEKLKK